MDEMTSAPTGEGEAISIEQAVGLLHAPEKPRDEKGRFAGQQNSEAAAATDEEEPRAADETELPDEGNVAQPDKAATDEDAGNDPAEEPPLDLPRSWSKDRAEHWAKLDRATQEFLLEHDSKASAEVRRAQNEAAEKAKSIDAEKQSFEQARKQYEEALPQLLNAIYNRANAEFSDIRSSEDVSALAEYPERYAKWDATQKQAQAIQAQIESANARRQQEEKKQFEEFTATETKKFFERAPEFADPKKAAQLAEEARELFADIGVPQDELQAIWQGQKISFHDHRVQLIIRDAMRYRAGQKALKGASPKPAPQVQRPGSAPAKGEARNAQLEALSSRLKQTHSVDDAVRLWQTRSRSA